MITCSCREPARETHHHLQPSSRALDILFQPPQAPGTYTVHRHTCNQNTHTHETKIKLQNKGKKELYGQDDECFMSIDDVQKKRI